MSNALFFITRKTRSLVVAGKPLAVAAIEGRLRSAIQSQVRLLQVSLFAAGGNECSSGSRTVSPRHEVKPKESRLRPAQSMKALQELVDRRKIELKGPNTATNVQRNQRRAVRQIVIQSINRLTLRHHMEMESKQHTYSLSPMHRGYCISNRQLKVLLNLYRGFCQVSQGCLSVLSKVWFKASSSFLRPFFLQWIWSGSSPRGPQRPHA